MTSAAYFLFAVMCLPDRPSVTGIYWRGALLTARCTTALPPSSLISGMTSLTVSSAGALTGLSLYATSSNLIGVALDRSLIGTGDASAINLDTLIGVPPPYSVLMMDSSFLGVCKSMPGMTFAVGISLILISLMLSCKPSICSRPSIIGCITESRYFASARMISSSCCISSTS